MSWGGDQDELRVYYKSASFGPWIELASYTSEVLFWSDITLALPNTSSDYYIAFQGTANYGRGITLDDVSVEDPTLGVVFSENFDSGSGASFGSGPKMMAVSANDANVLYVVEAAGGIFGGLYKSTDSGVSFTQLDHTGKNYFGYDTNGNDNSGQAPRDMDIAVNPNDVNDVTIAGINSWRSTNGGVSFSISSQWVPGNAAGLNIGYCHADIDILEYVGNRLFVGSDGGIFVANNPTNVNSNYYTDLSSGLGIKQFYRIGVSQTAQVVVTGGSQDNGSSVLANGAWTDWLGADGMEGFVDKNNSNIIYGTSQNGTLYRSFNLGNNVQSLPSPDGKTGNWITPFEQDPITQDVVYSGYDQVYKSDDGGQTWAAISQDFGPNIDHLKIAPSNNSVAYVAEGGSLYKTTALWCRECMESD